MKNVKLLTSIFLATVISVGTLAFASTANAQGLIPKLMFTHGPEANDQAIYSGQENVLYTEVQNVSDETITTPLCVEDVTVNRHLGCVPEVTLNPKEIFDFWTYRDFYDDGTHIIRYSYLDPNGTWNGILDSNHEVDTASFTVVR